ncbi:MAG: HEAT repeat domain-containing protein [Planctomycetales bacterium]|nr:HEAT repeat domain-containing protein [Planctomycetales bacterium]
MVERLHNRFTLFSSQTKVEIIRQIRDAGEPAAIAPLLYFLTGSNDEVVKAAADTIETLVCGLSQPDLVLAENSIRSTCCWSQDGGWWNLTPIALRKLAGLTNSPAVWGMASFHHSGYVREAAVRLLGTVRDGRELPFLLLRLNDWVVPVREAAKLLVCERLQSGDIAPFHKNIFLVVRLDDCKRTEHTEIVSGVVRNLVEAGNQQQLRNLIENQDRTVRRRMFRLACRVAGPHVAWLVECGLRSFDPSIRVTAVKQAETAFEGENLFELLDRLRKDRYMPVRRHALWLATKHFLDVAGTWLNEALFDRSYSIRELSQFYLRKMGHTDPAVVYRAVVNSNQRLRLAIAGLGETGTESDTALLEPYSRSSVVQLRRAALIALARLRGEQSIDLLLQSLADDNRKLTHDIKRALNPMAAHLPLESLRQMLDHDHRQHVRLAVVQLLDSMGAWSGLSGLIRAATDKDEKVAAAARVQIESRYLRLYTRPSNVERERIEDALGKIGQAELMNPFWIGFRKWFAIRIA